MYRTGNFFVADLLFDDSKYFTLLQICIVYVKLNMFSKYEFLHVLAVKIFDGLFFIIFVIL